MVDALPADSVLSVLRQLVDGGHHVRQRVDLVRPQRRRSAARTPGDARVQTHRRRVGSEVGANAHDACLCRLRRSLQSRGT